MSQNIPPNDAVPTVAAISLFQDDLMQSLTIATSLQEIEALRIQVLGRQGTLTLRLKALSTLSPDERQTQGAALNHCRQTFMAALQSRKQSFEKQAMDEKLATEKIDISLPPAPLKNGHTHPFTETLWELTQTLVNMGFDVVDGPEIETAAYNFSALNIPDHHPARQDHDTFYLTEKDPSGAPYVLRTHTSPVQIRTLQNRTPPLRIISPGRTFRCDSDATHTPNFHQIEGLWIDKDVHMGHLKGCLADMLRHFFNKPDLEVRLRPSYFPFTEPSAEIDIGCRWEKGQLILGGKEEWLEILGCGMVHGKVLENCNIDPSVYQGFAFGFGVERMAMLKYGIPDLRSFYDGNPVWSQHYGFSAARAFSALDQ